MAQIDSGREIRELSIVNVHIGAFWQDEWWLVEKVVTQGQEANDARAQALSIGTRRLTFQHNQLHICHNSNYNITRASTMDPKPLPIVIDEAAASGMWSSAYMSFGAAVPRPCLRE